MKNKKLFVLFTALTLAVTAFIFGNSLMDGETSSQASGFFSDAVRKLLELLGAHPDASTVSYAVRKTAHFSEYFVLSAAAWFALYNFKGNLRLCFASVGYSAAVAFADEFIMQRITAGRSPQITDVLIDCSGALLAAAVSWLIIRGRNNKKRGTQK
ncbi:MAG: VanZ family protein [Clostridia bacterium]|nr:VanZ family protein [Clostridia bacterium]